MSAVYNWLMAIIGLGFVWAIVITSVFLHDLHLLLIMTPSLFLMLLSSYIMLRGRL